MAVSPARQAAYRILRRVESGRDYAVDLLQRPDVSSLKEADRRLATELVMGVLRWHRELDFQIEQLSGKPLARLDPEIATILRLGIYQIRFLGKIPPSAAVNEAVELAKSARKRSAAGLVNAVLRKGAEGKRGNHGEVMAEAACRTLPEWLGDRWRKNFGETAIRDLALASVQTPPTTLRVCAGDSGDTVKRLAAEGVHVRPGQFGPRALVVESGNVHSSTARAEGLVVIQDEASQLVTELVAPRASERVLDVCAAPGIKAAQLAGILQQGELIACDLSRRRLATMVSILMRHLPPSVVVRVVRLDAARELPFGARFDRILVDAPCSGTGTLVRNPEIKLRLRPEDITRLAALQTSILRNALGVLAPGGRLVYTTCSLEPEENERVVESVLAHSQGFRSISRNDVTGEFPHLAPLFDERGYFRTRPDLHPMDGFFAAVLTTAQ